MNETPLEKLSALAEARKARDLAALEALTAEQRTLEAEIAELAGTEARDAAEGQMPFAMIAQRAAWSASQIALRERRIAAITVELAGVRAAARVSVGKHEALKKLIEGAERDRQAAENRAAELIGTSIRSRGGRS